MPFLIGLFTFALVVDCLILVLLVLIQLPKKDAGAGVAFGGAATDALFGAGSGNVLTKTTKYAATGLFVLAITLSIMQSRMYHHSTSEFRKELERQGKQPMSQQTPAPAPAAPVMSSTGMSGLNLLTNLQSTKTPPTPPQ
ncbi:MAG TPA: preprotein translocase subunit SecG [Verrucomicrobiae bacterium]|nr:preprotein translocase subunit SecG [Verrucomicrobiae bacterium]